MDNIKLSLDIYTSNINSIVSIFNDSDEIRKKRAKEFERKLYMENSTSEDFEQFNHYIFHFDWLLMQSLFISGFSYFENYMKSIAEIIEKLRGDRIKLNDIKGDGYLDTYRKYIYLIGDIQQANSDRKEWQVILEFKTIRNSIIHEDGIIAKKLSKIKEHNLYFGPSQKLIRIRNIKFLEDFVTTSTKYMESIALEIRQKTEIIE